MKGLVRRRIHVHLKGDVGRPVVGMYRNAAEIHVDAELRVAAGALSTDAIEKLGDELAARIQVMLLGLKSKDVLVSVRLK